MYRHVGFRRPAHRVECAAIRSLSDSLSSGRSRFPANRSLLEACSNEASTYGKCVSAKHDLKQNDCLAEFLSFMACIKQSKQM
eukprot:Em0005g1625a